MAGLFVLQLSAEQWQYQHFQYLQAQQCDQWRQINAGERRNDALNRSHYRSGNAVEQCIDRIVVTRAYPAKNDLDNNGEDKDVECKHHEFTNGSQQQLEAMIAETTVPTFAMVSPRFDDELVGTPPAGTTVPSIIPSSSRAVLIPLATLPRQHKPDGFSVAHRQPGTFIF